MKKSKESIRYLWDTIKRTNIHIRESQKETERNKRVQSLFEEIIDKTYKI